MKKIKIITIAGFVLSLLLVSVHASDMQSKADLAVANILFDFDAPAEFATYRIRDDGLVEIVFAGNMPDKVYSDVLAKLNNHPDIPDVLAGRGGPPCSLW